MQINHGTSVSVALLIAIVGGVFWGNSHIKAVAQEEAERVAEKVVVTQLAPIRTRLNVIERKLDLLLWKNDINPKRAETNRRQ